MNALTNHPSLKALLVALLAVGAAATIGLGLGSQSTPTRHVQAVVKLEPVRVVGKRAPEQAPRQAMATQPIVEQLPAVLVQGRRAPADIQMAGLRTQSPQ
jgi:hypothetical protein